MKRQLLQTALVAVIGAGLAWSALGSAAAQVAPDQQTAILAAHNTVRRNVAAAETQRLGKTVSIPDLTWDPAVASVAQDWANHLVATNTFEHNNGRQDLGENIYGESGQDPATAGPRAVASWNTEAASYNWDASSCSSVCGHYTQLVWAATTKVGCGIAGDRNSTIVVCDYAPPGNFVGQRPYEPGAPAPASNAPTQNLPANNPPATNPTSNQPATTPAQPTGNVPAATWTGSWNVDDFGFGAGGTLLLAQNGAQVTGTYTYADTSGCGMQTGTLTGTVAGNTLSFSFTESGCAGSGGGTGVVTLSADGNSFQGTWNGTRTGP